MIDKPLNPGNSGGPIIATESGKVFAICTGFQLMPVIQKHWWPAPVPIAVPSLYGIVFSLSNPAVIDVLRQHGIPISEE